jgi:hypothetical protein
MAKYKSGAAPMMNRMTQRTFLFGFLVDKIIMMKDSKRNSSEIIVNVTRLLIIIHS